MTAVTRPVRILFPICGLTVCSSFRSWIPREEERVLHAVSLPHSLRVGRLSDRLRIR